MKIPYRFDPDTEAKYLEMKFQESKTFVVMVGFATSLLAVGLWAWDWVIDPAHAMDVLGSRTDSGRNPAFVSSGHPGWDQKKFFALVLLCGRPDHPVFFPLSPEPFEHRPRLWHFRVHVLVYPARVSRLSIQYDQQHRGIYRHRHKPQYYGLGRNRPQL